MAEEQSKFMMDRMQKEEAAKARENLTKDFASIIENLAMSRVQNTSVRRPRKVHGNHKLSYDANREFPEKPKEQPIDIGKIAKIFNFSVHDHSSNENQNNINFTNQGKTVATKQRIRPPPPKKKPVYETSQFIEGSTSLAIIGDALDQISIEEDLTIQ